MASPTAQDAVNYARRFPCSDAHARYIAKNYLLNHGESLEETLGLIEEANAIISGEPSEPMQPIETAKQDASEPAPKPAAKRPRAKRSMAKPKAAPEIVHKPGTILRATPEDLAPAIES